MQTYETKEEIIKEFEEQLKPTGVICKECNQELNQLNQSPDKELCWSCYHE